MGKSKTTRGAAKSKARAGKNTKSIRPPASKPGVAKTKGKAVGGAAKTQKKPAAPAAKAKKSAPKSPPPKAKNGAQAKPSSKQKSAPKGQANKPKVTTQPAGARGSSSTSERALAELAARWPIVSDAEREAFASLISDAQADELGKRTKAVDVRDEAARWAVVIDGALRMYPGALEGYAPRRFAYLLSVARDLSSTIASEDQRRGHAGDVRGHAVDARQSAMEARSATLDRLATFAGQRGPERSSLQQATGLADPVELLIRSLRALAHLEIDWLERTDPASQVLAESAGLSQKDATGLRAHAEALSAKRVAQALEGKAVAKDTPIMNRFEGRLLFEMREARRIFSAAHDKNPVIPNLIPGPGVKAVIGAKRAAVAAPPPPAPSSPGDNEPDEEDAAPAADAVPSLNHHADGAVVGEAST